MKAWYKVSERNYQMFGTIPLSLLGALIEQSRVKEDSQSELGLYTGKICYSVIENTEINISFGYSIVLHVGSILVID